MQVFVWVWCLAWYYRRSTVYIKRLGYTRDVLLKWLTIYQQLEVRSTVAISASSGGISGGLLGDMLAWRILEDTFNSPWHFNSPGAQISPWPCIWWRCLRVLAAALRVSWSHSSLKFMYRDFAERLHNLLDLISLVVTSWLEAFTYLALKVKSLPWHLCPRLYRPISTRRTSQKPVRNLSETSFWHLRQPVKQIRN